jgi:cobalt-zinc-cadmium efflux system outer membrane protein
LAGAVLLLATLRASAVQAEEKVAPLSLADARALALAHNWEILAAQSDLDLADAQRQIARALPNPQVSAAYSRLDLRAEPSATGASAGGTDTLVSVSQLVELGGKRRARIHSAAAGLEGARARFDFVRNRLDAEVVKAYAAVLQAEANVRVTGASTESLRRSADIAEQRFQAGDISEVEKDQVEIAAGRFAADLRTAEAAAAQARVALQVLLGVARPGGSLTLADTLDALAARATAFAARLGATETMAGERGDVRAAAAAVVAAEADLRLQQARPIPDLTLTGQFERDLPDNPRTLGFSVSLPVPLFDRNRGGIRAAEISRDAAARERERTRAQAQAEVVTARAALDAALARQALVRGSLVERAEKVEATVRFAYEAGGASLLELLEAERNLNDLHLSASAIVAEALSAAADLAAARGETLE